MALGALAGAFVADGFGLRAPYFMAAALLLVPLVIVVATFTTARIDAALAEAAADESASAL
jgi:predicted MFS family arabinose efflux permease